MDLYEIFSIVKDRMDEIGQDVRLAEQRAGEQHLDLISVAEVLHLGVQNGVRVQSQTVEQTARLGLGVPAVHLGKFGFQLGSLVLPTLVPFLLWLWLDRQFVNDVLVEAWKKSVQPKLMPKPVVKPPPPPPPEQVIRPAESGAEISHSVSITLPPRKNS